MTIYTSIDAETNGLRGRAFAIGAVVTDDEGTIDQLVLRCPITEPVNEWVAANVLPAVADLKQTHDTYEGMLEAFRVFLDYYEGLIVAHVAWPVEARLLLDTYPGDGGPYPLIDVAGALLAGGHDPTSVDGFLAKRDASVEGYGSPHHPLYDAVAAERCLRLLTAESR